ncbi:MAG TPA: alanine racemase [Tepidisphaeraceae bacterium]|jgi:alanine racemase|nr:alanine racemase [Tepidisphaeraceae bacterium]
MDNSGVVVRVDLGRVCGNAAAVAARTGVPVIGVVKANAYGLGGKRVARALAGVPGVEGFYAFSLGEAVEYELAGTGKPTLVLEPTPMGDVGEYVSRGVRPSVWTVEGAERMRRARPVLSVETGMQRFAAAADQVDAIIKAGDIKEAMTHATRLEHVEQLQRAVEGYPGLKLHAAGTALLNEPRAYLDATRPGVALYSNALTVTAPLYQVRESGSPAGYTGFMAPRHGLILLGYQHGLRMGPCLVNGRRARLLEVGMQTSFVEVEGSDKVGDPVTLISEDLPADVIAGEWRCGPHEVLLRLSAVGAITYVGGD